VGDSGKSGREEASTAATNESARGRGLNYYIT
jgi:hypothetical protein